MPGELPVPVQAALPHVGLLSWDAGAACPCLPWQQRLLVPTCHHMGPHHLPSSPGTRYSLGLLWAWQDEDAGAAGGT